MTPSRPASMSVKYPREQLGHPCPEGCGGTLVLRDSRRGPFYGCSRHPWCDATHGAHPNGAPLGTPANRETRDARVAAHAVFDQLWQAPSAPFRTDSRGHLISRSKARRRAYAAVARELGLKVLHIGDADVALCKRLEARVRERWPHVVGDAAHPAEEGKTP